MANCNIAKTGLTDSSLRSAQAQVQNAKNNLDSLIAPRVEKLTQAGAQLERARLSLEQARNALADAEIVAPFDGIITAVNVTAGGLGNTSAALEIADIRQLHVDVLVDETQIGIVQPGQNVNLTLDALPGITVTGKVDAIDPAGTVSQGVVNYNVRVLLDPTAAPLKLDMTTNASIIGETQANVLAVPTTAIRTGGQGGFGGQRGCSGQGGFGGQAGQGNFTNQGGQGRQNGQGGISIQSGQGVTETQRGQPGGQRVQGPFVLVMRNGQAQPVQVTEGLTVDDMTEVSGDLQEGDQVLIITATPTQSNNAGGPPGGFFPGGGRPPFD